MHFLLILACSVNLFNLPRYNAAASAWSAVSPSSSPGAESSEHDTALHAAASELRSLLRNAKAVAAALEAAAATYSALLTDGQLEQRPVPGTSVFDSKDAVLVTSNLACEPSNRGKCPEPGLEQLYFLCCTTHRSSSLDTAPHTAPYTAPYTLYNTPHLKRLGTSVAKRRTRPHRGAPCAGLGRPHDPADGRKH